MILKTWSHELEAGNVLIAVYEEYFTCMQLEYREPNAPYIIVYVYNIPLLRWQLAHFQQIGIVTTDEGQKYFAHKRCGNIT